MKQIYILTNEQAEELKFIQTRIVSDINIIEDILKDESIRITVREALDNVLRRIESYCSNMEDILVSE